MMWRFQFHVSRAFLWRPYTHFWGDSLRVLTVGPFVFMLDRKATPEKEAL